MGEGSWSFRTNNGIVSIRTGVLTVRSTPRLFLTGQYARWREGSSWQRAKLGFQAFGLVSVFGRYFQYLLQVSQQGPGINIETGLVVFLSALYLGMIWMLFIHVRTISLSNIHDVSLDASDGELTVNFERKGNLHRWLGRGNGELEITPRSPDDLREAREILSLRGFSIGGPLDSRRSSNDSRSVSRENRQPEPTHSVE